MKDGFLAVAAAVPEIRLGHPLCNAQIIAERMREAHRERASLLLFPELVLTGATCGDLFFDGQLLAETLAALKRILEAGRLLPHLVTVVGLPFRRGGLLHDAAAVLLGGRILGIVPKGTLSPAERRFFSPGPDGAESCVVFGEETPFGGPLLFEAREFPLLRFGVVFPDDLETPFSAAERAAENGASLLLVPAARPEGFRSGEERKRLLRAESARLRTAVLLASAGSGESTGDAVYAGAMLAAECGDLISEPPLFRPGLVRTEFDLGRVAAERLRAARSPSASVRGPVLSFDLPIREVELTRPVPADPYLSGDPDGRARECERILTLQAEGLAHRLAHVGCRTAVLGVSGGLDSALALLVAVRSAARLGRSPSSVLAVSMPCFGTTGASRRTAAELCRLLGVTFREIDIRETVRSHFRDIGQEESVTDITYENAQARERTRVLMDLANKENGIVVGTGDLSELALGWATFNGDHMAMYGVNASVPKTSVRALVAHEAGRLGGPLGSLLRGILDTPISPELLPSVGDVNPQLTEESVGPYELHDFFLYHLVRYGFRPRKIYRLACLAFRGRYPEEVILRWLRFFYGKFFRQQFKRNCLPEGVSVGDVSLSPRGRFLMPSDMTAELWQEDLRTL